MILAEANYPTEGWPGVISLAIFAAMICFIFWCCTRSWPKQAAPRTDFPGPGLLHICG